MENFSHKQPLQSRQKREIDPPSPTPMHSFFILKFLNISNDAFITVQTHVKKKMLTLETGVRRRINKYVASFGSTKSQSGTN